MLSVPVSIVSCLRQKEKKKKLQYFIRHFSDLNNLGNNIVVLKINARNFKHMVNKK